MTIFQISPYAAKAIVHHVWTGTALLVWATFRFPMDTAVKPPNASWLLKLDGVPKGIVFPSWLDEFTIQLNALAVTSLPGQVTLAYLGPDTGLRTTWDKQWEPWGPITSIAIPIDDNLKAIHTVEGGSAIKLTNKSGANSVAGDVVRADVITPDAVTLSPASDLFPIGVFYQSGIADGSEAWIVHSGIADVHMDAGGCALNDRIITSPTAGRGLVNNLPAVGVHFQEIGHSIEIAAANANARCVLHFN